MLALLRDGLRRDRRAARGEHRRLLRGSGGRSSTRADLTPKEVRLLEHLARKMAQPRGSTARSGSPIDDAAVRGRADDGRRLLDPGAEVARAAVRGCAARATGEAFVRDPVASAAAVPAPATCSRTARASGRPASGGRVRLRRALSAGVRPSPARLARSAPLRARCVRARESASIASTRTTTHQRRRLDGSVPPRARGDQLAVDDLEVHPVDRAGSCVRAAAAARCPGSRSMTYASGERRRARTPALSRKYAGLVCQKS